MLYPTELRALEQNIQNRFLNVGPHMPHFLILEWTAVLCNRFMGTFLISGEPIQVTYDVYLNFTQIE